MTPKYRSTAAARRCFAVILGLIAPSFLRAQTAPATTPAQTSAADAAKTDALLLTPFEVKTDQDRGYAGGNTLSGSRVDTPLKITPNSISVMTKEFLEDFAITDMNQAAQWTVGMEPPQGGESGPFGGNRFQASFRGGDSGANFPTRDGALQYFIADSFNSERFEFSRGPSTALFGDGGPGGIQGSQSKQARLNSKFGEIQTRVDSYGGYRGTFDYNFGLDNLGFRVNGLHQNTKGYQDGTSNKQNQISLAATWKFAASTQLRWSYDRGAEWNIQYRKFYSDQQSLWDRSTVNVDNLTTIVNPASFGLSQISATNDYLVYNFGTKALYNYKGNQYQSAGLGYAIPWEGRPEFGNFPGVAKDFFLGPADSFADRDLNAKALYLEHRFSPDWSLQLAYIASDVDPVQRNIGGGQGSDRRIDVNRLLPNGAANPNFGKTYSDTGGQSVQYQQDSVKEYRLTTNYKFAVPKLFDLKQSFNFNGGWRRGIYEMSEKSWRWANNPLQADLTNGVNSLRYRMYWDQPRQSIAPVLPPSEPGYAFRYIKTTPGNQARRSRTLTYGQLFSQTTFWDDRIAVSGSFRRDKIVLNSIAGISFDANYEPILGFNGVAGARGLRTAFLNSKSAGTVIYPFPDSLPLLKPLGFVANYSSNFQQIPNSTTPLISGDQAPLTQAVTKDFGLRYSVGNEGKLYLTLSHYNTKRTNVLSDWNNNPGGIRDNLRSIYLNLGYPNDNALIGPQGFNFQDYRDEKLEGWESEVTANPTRNLTFILNYSHPIVVTVRDAVERRIFIDAHMAEFQAGAAAQVGQIVNGRTILDPVAIQNALQSIANTFNGTTNGTLQNGGERHRVNLAGSYRFTDGLLKGVGTNAGVVYRGYKKIGSRDARIKFQTATPTVAQTAEAAYDYLWTDPTYTATVGVNYTRRFGKVQARFQINVDNVFNNDQILWNGYSTINAGQLNRNSTANVLTVPGGNPRMQVLTGNAGGNLQFDPRKFTFTTRFSF